MWETSRFRGKNQGYGGAGSGSSGGGGRRKPRAPRMRMKRILAQLHVNNGWGVPSTEYTVRMVLNDLGPASVTIFSPQPFELGHQVSLSIEHPRPLHVRGRVTYCALFELTSRIHAANKFPYRLQLEFEFLNDGEAIAVREYVEELVRVDLAKTG